MIIACNKSRREGGEYAMHLLKSGRIKVSAQKSTLAQMVNAKYRYMSHGCIRYRQVPK